MKMSSRAEDLEYTQNQRVEKNLQNIVLVSLQVQVSIKNLKRLLVIGKSLIESHVKDLNTSTLVENKEDKVKGLNKEYL